MVYHAVNSTHMKTPVISGEIFTRNDRDFFVLAIKINHLLCRCVPKQLSDDATQQGDLFAHVYQNPDKKIEVDTTQGFEDRKSVV